MSESTDKHLEALQGMWGELKGINARLDATNERLDVTNERLDGAIERLDVTNERLDGAIERIGAVESAVDRLGRRQTEGEIRIATEIIAVAEAVGGMRGLLETRRDQRERIDALERRVETLERKVP